MTMQMRVERPITFSPAIAAEDACANYWLRQVTVRLRRQICWLRHERGALPEAHSGALPPYVDKVQATLDMSRFADEKSTFHQTDPTACYLTDLLSADPPRADEHLVQGSFGWVINELGMDDLSAFVLALGLAVAFDSAMGGPIAACLNDPTKRQPNLALAQKLWDEPDHLLSLVDPTHALFRRGLLVVGAQTPHDHSGIDWDTPLRVPPAVANQLLYPSSPVPSALTLIASADENGDESPLTDSVRLVAARLACNSSDSLRVVPVRGPKGSAHVEVVRALASMTQRAVVQLTADPHLLADRQYLNSLATVCWLRGVDLFVCEDLVSVVDDDRPHPPTHFLPALSIPITVLLGVSDRSQVSKLPSGSMMPIVDVPRLSYHQRVAHWKQTLGTRAEGLDPVISEASRRFRYGKETISSICEGLRTLPGPISRRDLVAACRAELAPDIGQLAQRVTPRFHDESLFLPHRQELQFQEVVKAMHSLTEVHYSWGTATAWNEAGIAVLFAGPPGTGKTMAAEILAIELDLPMYRIDLSQVVNKYIGETEKSLKRLFDAADATDIILFFDEADSLFGKRTEVRDAHDRYANLEISYLLERMERFKGLAILATNRKKDLDEAFLRRLRFIVDFPMPDEAQRRKIWLQVTPKTVDTSEIDFHFLARRFQLAGGHIRSIVFSACLQSAEGSSVDDGAGEGRLTMKDIIVAVKREYDKLNRPISLECFGPYAGIVQLLEHAHEPR